MFKNIRLYVSTLALLATAGASADTLVKLSPLSIAAGEQQQVELSVESDLSDIYCVEATLVLPRGLAFARLDNEKFVVPVAAGAGADGSAELNNTTGKVVVVNLAQQPFTGEGPVARFAVEADNNLPFESYIRLSDVVVKRTGGETVQPRIEASVVTRADVVHLTFAPEAIEVDNGQTFEVSVALENSVALLTGLQARLVVPAALEVVSVAKSDRLDNLSYNAETQMVVVSPTAQGISGQEGAAFTLKLKARDTFAGVTELQIDDVVATAANSSRYLAPAAVLPVKVLESRAFLSFAEERVELKGGSEVSVDVELTNRVAIAGLQARLVLPQGITATVEKSDRLTDLAYQPATGMIVVTPTGITGEEGTVFTITLKADTDLEAQAEVALTDIVLTTTQLAQIKPEAISLAVENGTVVGVSSARAQQQPQQVYSLSGRQLPQLQKGVNIVRMADGSTKKIAK